MQPPSLHIRPSKIHSRGDTASARSDCASSRILFLGADDSVCRRIASKFHWDLVTAGSAAEVPTTNVAHDAAIIDLDCWTPQTAANLFSDLLIPANVVALATESSHPLIATLRDMGLIHIIIRPFLDSQVFYSIQTVLLGARERPPQFREQEEVVGSRIIGGSEICQKLRRQAQLLSTSSIPVHFTGKTGVGKDVASLEFHERSCRKHKTFLPVNCSTLGTLAESELFGHTRGAFTNAVRSTRGYVGAADGGTLFLDEIGDLSLDVQTKLLRFLDTGEYSRVGESEPRRGDVRVITATNKDLWQLCLQGKFREDLYYRITGAVFRISPLRERREDIAPLARHFLRQLGKQSNRIYRFASDAIATLCLHEWPGNARQLRQAIHLLAESSEGREVNKQDVKRELENLAPADKPAMDLGNYQQAKINALREFDLVFFSNLIGISNGSLKEALALTGMHKKNFYEKLKELSLTMKKSDASVAG